MNCIFLCLMNCAMYIETVKNSWVGVDGEFLFFSLTGTIKVNSEGAYELAELIRSVKQLVVLTGAGISTESGIPDFRSPGGVWENYRPVTIQEFMADGGARRRYWAYKKDTFPSMSAAEPNAGHLAVGELERRGKLQALITQNIDGLHQEAGNDPSLILELHGTERCVLCLTCGEKYPRELIQERLEAGVEVPLCDGCDGWLKPATISFGQSLSEDVLQQALNEANNCEAMLVIGSSLQVHPAAQLPEIAKRSGAWLGILNRDITPLDYLADWTSRDSAGSILEAAVNMPDEVSQ